MCFFGEAFSACITLKGILYGQNEAQKKLCFTELSRDDWIRTSDPVVPNDVRYRTALHPEKILPGQK